MNAGPVFVTGPDRSGTTLLYSLLATHPAISMVRRTNMWRWFYGRFGDLSDPVNLDRALAQMVAYQRMAVLAPDPDRLRAEFVEGPSTYGRLFDLAHRHRAERIGKPRWGDKSLHTEHHAAAVFAEYPDARIIHLMRDPRDRHASVSRRYGGRDKGMASITGRWLASTRVGERNLASYPDRYLMIRYEDLAREPVATLQQVCRFIGEQYTDAMLAMNGAPDDQSGEGNSSFGTLAPGTISTRSIGRFTEVLTPAEIAFVQRTCRRAMGRHGYRLVPVSWSPRARARYWGTLPLGAARLGGWLVNDGRARRRGEPIPTDRLEPAGRGAS